MKNEYLRETWRAERGDHHCPSREFPPGFWPEESRIGINILAINSRHLLQPPFSPLNFLLCHYGSLLPWEWYGLFGSRKPTSLLWTVLTDAPRQRRDTNMGNAQAKGPRDAGFLSRCNVPAHSGLSSLKLIAKS